MTGRTLLGDAGALVNVELRYSPGCEAAWARIADGRAGDTVSIRTAGGQQQSAVIHYGTDDYTPMINIATAQSVTACATDAGAPVCIPAQTLPPTGPLPAQAATTAIQGDPPAFIRPGDAGPGVRCIQEALNYWDHAGLPVDGVDGNTTTDAVERFQREQNLSVDGVVGPDTAGPIYAIDDAELHLGGTCRHALPTPRTHGNPWETPRHRQHPEKVDTPWSRWPPYVAAEFRTAAVDAVAETGLDETDSLWSLEEQRAGSAAAQQPAGPYCPNPARELPSGARTPPHSLCTAYTACRIPLRR